MKRIGMFLIMVLLLAAVGSCSPMRGTDVDESTILPAIQLTDS